MNGSMISSAVTAGVAVQAIPVDSNPYVALGWSVLSAVLGAVLSWLAGRKAAN